MGLIQLGKDALAFGKDVAGGVVRDQWREFFIYPSMGPDVLLVKGMKQDETGRNKGTENIITNNSAIVVNAGQYMIIVDDGVVKEVALEPGRYVYKSDEQGSIIGASMEEVKKGLLDSIKEAARRMTFAGETSTDQRIYFINAKEIIGNKYGTQNPVAFRVVDNNIGMDLEISLRMNGEYTYKIVDPVAFYSNIVGNINGDFRRSQIDGQLKTELLNQLQPALAKVSDMGVRYSSLMSHSKELRDAMREMLKEDWLKRFGIEIESITINSAIASDEDINRIKKLQEDGVYRSPSMLAVMATRNQGEALKAAAANESTGSMMAFAGMNMGQNAGNAMMGGILNEAAKENEARLNRENAASQQVQNQQVQAVQNDANTWTCECGSKNTGKFCGECGKAKPQVEEKTTWKCECGTENTGKFCSECGKAKPQQ